MYDQKFTTCNVALLFYATLSQCLVIFLTFADVVISFEEAEYTVSESVGVTEVCVELCTGEPKRDFEFYVDVINSSATSKSFSLSLPPSPPPSLCLYLSLYLSFSFKLYRCKINSPSSRSQ